MQRLPCLILLVALGFLSACTAPEKVSTIIPGTGVGSVRLGMSMGQVKGLLGEPRIQKAVPDGMSYAYPSAGISLLVGNADKHVRRIDAGSGYTEGEWLREFWGSTHEGIGIGSTKEQVTHAYGPPDPPPATRNRNVSTDDWMAYRQRGISFLFNKQQVVRIGIYPAVNK